MKIDSHDPRISRADIPAPEDYDEKQELDQWHTYEVFHQKDRGTHHVHVGSVHAANPEIAMLFAKEQYARRMKCVNLWVVKTADISPSSYEDADMFSPGTDKSYREAFGYKVRDLIKAYKERKNEEAANS